MIVVDTNVVAYLLIPGDHAEAAAAVYAADCYWSAPLLWRSEFRNIVAYRLRRGLLNFEDACELQRRAERLLGTGYEVDSEEVLALARDSQCTAYDCEYVALALQLKTTLVTNDRQVVGAFPGIAVPFT